MIFKIRVVLDTQEDVIRTLLIDSDNTLEALHNTILNSFDFDGQQMASFYRTDDDWNQGEEIPLVSMDDSPGALEMGNTTIAQNMEDKGEKLIYVYDFLEMWTFYVELIEKAEKADDNLPKIVMSIGEVPDKSPEKEFKSDNNPKAAFDDPYGLDDEFDNFNEFESLDNVDPDLY